MENSITIASSRFNQQTWEENCSYRREKNISGCIYGSPCQLSSKIPPKTLVFISEMNNTTNKIEGIGLIYNIIKYDKYHRVYDTGNYNRYIYGSDFRISRNVLMNYNPELVKALEQILFKGKTHMKRGSGITTVPEKLLKHKVFNEQNVRKELSDIFKQYFQKVIHEENV
jgi:peptide deformylase|uniref:Uncharacterized protein n=1 Tax=viral metagenome TaxID=1070528 RepID=A0A6C0DUF5_9ZZZZ